MTRPPPHNHLRLLISTRRPAVERFFSTLARNGLGLRVDRTVVDVGLDGLAGVDVCAELRRRRPELPLVALLCCAQALTPWDLRTLVGLGVGGVLDLQATPDETLRALQAVAAGGTVLHLHLRRGHRALLRDILTGRGASATQLRLLELVALGLPDHEIARRVHLSPHTVKHHIEQLRRQVGARNRTELAAWAGRQGLYAPERDDVVPVQLTTRGQS
jgi:DNA-binding NarL/FixJ family response regulator